MQPDEPALGGGFGNFEQAAQPMETPANSSPPKAAVVEDDPFAAILGEVAGKMNPSPQKPELPMVEI